MSTFSISSYSDTNLIDINAPLKVSYLIDEKHTVDNTTGAIYPNNAVTQHYVYNSISNIANLLGNVGDIPVYSEWDWNLWYAGDSLVYTYDETSSSYRFYKSLKMTSPVISLSNDTYWNTYVSQVWSTGYTYDKGTIVHTYINGVYNFYESKSDISIDIDISDGNYWIPLSLESWSLDSKYNIGSKVYSGTTVYTCIKTILGPSRLDNKEYWTPYFNYYGLLSLLDTASDFKTSLETLQTDVLTLKSKFELNTEEYTDEQMTTLYNEMNVLNTSIQTKWTNSKTLYVNMAKDVSSKYGLIWKNMYDVNIYFKELNLYNVDPMKVLDSIRNLPSFSSLLNEESKEAIIVYVKNLYDQQDPSQKNGGYFIYDVNKSRFIKVLVGQHGHGNKTILDEITQSYDELSELDNISNKVLTIVKEPVDDEDYSWEFHAQWKDIDVIPDKPTDGKEYVLITGPDGKLTWTDKISSSVAFVKVNKEVLSDTASLEFDIDLSFDNEGNVIDSLLLFKNNLYIGDFTSTYDVNANILNIGLRNDEIFNAEDLVTLIVIRNTSAEMLSRLADRYVSKEEAIEILSNGNIRLVDYVKKDTLSKYSLRNHMHTIYAIRDHSHHGIYADYYHNHDGLYMTRDEVNSVLGNILSINPDLIEIISRIAGDASALGTFVTKSIFDSYKESVEQRLQDLESIDESSLYFDTNTGMLSRVSIEDDEINYTWVDIESFQIQTKYKISDDPEELNVYNLEEYLDHMLDLIYLEDLRIKKIYQQAMITDRVSKSYVLRSTNDDGLDISDFVINNIKLEITEAFDDEINIKLNTEIFIDSDEIIEGNISTMDYNMNYEIIGESRVSFDLGLSSIGKAVLTITGFSV